MPISRDSPVKVKCHHRPVDWPISDLMSITAAISGALNVAKLVEVSRDFRSDTLTIPTDDQILASLTASRGDSTYQEDADTNALERRVAALCGKEDALFCASGVMANQIAMRCHLRCPPHSIILDARSHIFRQESGGMSFFSQAMPIPLKPVNGHHLQKDEIEASLIPLSNSHGATTRLICLESPLAGTIMPHQTIQDIGVLGRAHNVKVHMDGARIWEVLAKRLEEGGRDARAESCRKEILSEILGNMDSATLCLSKGLGAPVGSMLVGSSDFIHLARRIRKAFGGSLRQSGSIAKMADFALTNHLSLLTTTHRLAVRLAEGLVSMGCNLLEPVETNMVCFDSGPAGVEMSAMRQGLLNLDLPIRIGLYRIVVHYQIDSKAVIALLDCFAALRKRCASEVACATSLESRQFSYN